MSRLDIQVPDNNDAKLHAKLVGQRVDAKKARKIIYYPGKIIHAKKYVCEYQRSKQPILVQAKALLLVCIADSHNTSTWHVLSELGLAEPTMCGTR
jgi:hypothetical protein